MIKVIISTSKNPEPQVLLQLAPLIKNNHSLSSLPWLTDSIFSLITSPITTRNTVFFAGGLNGINHGINLSIRESIASIFSNGVTKLFLYIPIASATLLLIKIRKDKTSVAMAITAMLEPLAKHVKSITYDNGLEFTAHTEVMAKLSCQSYFADPYSSWQRGSNENTNGLIRQWFPKKQPISKDNTAILPQVINDLNNRPRKRYGYKSPNKIFETKKEKLYAKLNKR